jgi:hypothetical protein
MKNFISLIAAAVITASAYAGPRPPALTDALLDAIRQVESGGDDRAVGDNGRAIGPYQIWRAYWIDACEYDPSLRDRGYEACFDAEYSRRVVIAYLSRYGQGKSAKELARIHNGGPRGHRKSATIAYWNKVQDALEDER